MLRLISLVTAGDAAFLFSSADVDGSLERRGFARVGGTYFPFSTGGTFAATASFEWYAPKGEDRVN